MDLIARQAGVSKATLYSHWADKEALLLEVMLWVNGLDEEPEDVDTGDLEQDLAIVLSRRPPDKFDQARILMTPALIAYSATHQEFGALWRNSVMEPPRRCLKRILRRAIKRGLLPGNLDLEISMGLLLGPMLYRHIFYKGHPDNIGSQVAHAFCLAYHIKTRRQSWKKKWNMNGGEDNDQKS